MRTLALIYLVTVAAVAGALLHRDLSAAPKAKDAYGRPSAAEPVTIYLPVNACKVDSPLVLDGDTIKTPLVRLPFKVGLRDETIRAATYDAWETSRQRFSDTTKAEIEKGKKAEEYLKELLSKGDLYIIESPKRPRDSFGRLLADLYVATKDKGVLDVSLEMRKNGHGREVYTPGMPNP